MYGTAFVQHYGWYIRQTFFRLGVSPFFLAYASGGAPYLKALPDLCPGPILRQLQKCREWAIARRALQKTGAPSQVVYAHDQASQKMKSAVAKQMENLTREEFGFPRVGEGWINESLLYKIVQSIYPEEVIKRHHKPKWLGGLELDIFLPGLNLGVEYQGQQHYHPIKAWGGDKALQALKARDLKKKRLCRDKGIHLVCIDYREPLTPSHIKMRLTSGA
ncbi:hypothetical protein IIA16_00340 [bacterium]|nr:hypothetical protein [bacterium]